MVIIIKKKYKKVPDKYTNCSTEEGLPKPLDSYSIRGYGPSASSSLPVAKSIDELLVEKKSQLTPIYPAAWGWNANGRAGNVTMEQVSEPRYTQKSADNRFIACAAGHHHSLLVADNGVVYSFGEGRDGQLGYGNPFFDRPKKGGDVQVIPRAVNPSGVIKKGRDLKIVEVACGGTFSLAREGGNEEGVSLCKGLRSLEMALEKIFKKYGDSPPVQFAWACVRQERAELSHSFSGQILSWGRGDYGQLGQGRVATYRPYPQPVPKLENISIAQISAGMYHALAVSKDGRLFSWGRGKSGALGHCNNKDQFYPKPVTYFEHHNVIFCAAGDAHSVVIIKNKKLSLNPMMNLPMIASFGRGAHGRLGMNNNKSNSTPRVVLQWPPSSKGMTFTMVAAGGAHSLALATKEVPKTLANPYGMVTNIYAWGFGSNGQLGIGDKLEDSFVPVKVKMPKWELVCEVSAGRSWSVARTVTGDIYTWGKGLRGQLGHGHGRDFSVAPRKVSTFASFLGIASGYAHNVAITTTRRHLNKSISETFVKDVMDSRVTPGMDQVDILNASSKRLQKSLAGYKSLAMRSFNCCRRFLPLRYNKVRVRCEDCDLDDICLLCGRHCHRNHTLVAMDYCAQDYDDIKFCMCGVFNEKCRLFPTIPEIRRDDVDCKDDDVSEYPLPYVKPKYKIRDQKEEVRLPRIEERSNKKVLKTLKSGEVFVRKKKVCEEIPLLGDELREHLQRERARLLRVCQEERKAGMNDCIPMSVTSTKYLAAKSIQGLARSFVGKIQLRRMMAYVRYIRRTACEQYWEEYIMSKVWKGYERSHERYRESREIMDMEVAEKERKMYDFYHGLQSALLGMDFMLEGIKMLMGKASVMIPDDETAETLDDNSIEDDVIEGANNPSYVYSKKAIREINLMKKKSDRLHENVIAIVSKKFPLHDPKQGAYFDPDVPNFTTDLVRVPSIELAKAEINRIANLSLYYYRAAELSGELYAIASGNVAKTHALNSHDLQTAISVLKDTPFEGLHAKLTSNRAKKERKRRPITKEEVIKERDRLLNKFSRRRSVAAPERMYHRVRLVRPYLQRKAQTLRRDSLPARVSELYLTPAPRFAYTDEIYQSLDVFYARQLVIQEHYLKEYAYVWKRVRPAVKKQKMQKALGFAWLNPRLPREMNQLVKQRRYPVRRNSIGEPERLAKQVAVMIETRNTLLGLKTHARKRAKIHVRRRSFDYGEELDAADYINTSLGYVFDENPKLPLVNQLQKDSIMMENLIYKADLPETDPLKQIQMMGKKTGIYEIGGQAGVDQSELLAEEVENIEWKEFYAEDGTVYYFCESTGESSWSKPVGGNIHILQQFQDTKDEKWYWFNTVTGETSPLEG